MPIDFQVATRSTQRTLWSPPAELGRPKRRGAHKFSADGLDLPAPGGVGQRGRANLLRIVGEALEKIRVHHWAA